jgi:hypothetical protein
MSSMLSTSKNIALSVEVIFTFASKRIHLYIRLVGFGHQNSQSMMKIFRPAECIFFLLKIALSFFLLTLLKTFLHNFLHRKILL